MTDKGESFKTGMGEKKVDTPPGKFAEKRKEIARLKIVLDNQNFIPEDVLNAAHRRFINEVAAVLGLAGDDLARQVCDLDGFNEASPEQVYEAVASRMFLLEEEVEKARERSIRDEGGGKGPHPKVPTRLRSQRAIRGRPQRAFPRGERPRMI
jgi:Fe-S-cluster formation regulator IscX/YfhJ